MLKSLFSGVSGLQSHQVAMDIESNNIANVNTTGFKYSRANFSDLLAQTKAIATAPKGNTGGINPMQLGLGSTVNSATRIFSQGSVENSDKITDMAIQGDGFFVISGDGGNTYKYTRAGDFKIDAAGNFVDNNGFVAQGWPRDKETGKVDSTAPITSINIPPGLTTPANATAQVVIKANLNSGPQVYSFAPAYEVRSDSNPALGFNADTPARDSLGNPIASDSMGVMFNESGEAFSLQNGQGVWASFVDSKVTATNPVDPGVGAGNIVFELDDGSFTTINFNLLGVTPGQNASLVATAINEKSWTTGITATVDSATNQIKLLNNNGIPGASHNINIVNATANSGFTAGQADKTAWKYTYNPAGVTTAIDADKEFSTIAQLREAFEKQANAHGTTDVKVDINSQGRFVLTNENSLSSDLNIRMTSFSGVGVTANEKFTRSLEAMNGVVPAGSAGKAYSQGFNAATHSSSIDIFDSLGSKHTLRTEFRKTSLDTATGSTWDLRITVPEPATIDIIAPQFEKKGSIRFNNDGSLATFNPPNVSFTANNGSSPDQQVDLKLGTLNSFDGLTSFDSKSSTSGIQQDGFTGGDLVGIRIDQSGTLVGSFSNGRSFGLAQIAMAKFTNNEGLSTEGGNVYIQTANSGDPIIGTAATSGRGFIQSAALEASNVDLSRALTQLIIIQRGYQANSKTITTSDQLLQTLIGLKQ